MQESSQKKIEDRASSLWGNDLHKKFHSAPSHCGQIIDIFPEMTIQERYWSEFDRQAVKDKFSKYYLD